MSTEVIRERPGQPILVVRGAPHEPAKNFPFPKICWLKICTNCTKSRSWSIRAPHPLISISGLLVLMNGLMSSHPCNSTPNFACEIYSQIPNEPT